MAAAHTLFNFPSRQAAASLKKLNMSRKEKNEQKYQKEGSFRIQVSSLGAVEDLGDEGRK